MRENGRWNGSYPKRYWPDGGRVGLGRFRRVELIRIEARLQNASRHWKRRLPGPACVAFLDDAGRLLDDGSGSPWTGRTLAELKASLPPGWPLTVVGGIDPLVLLGLKKGLAS